MTLKDRSAGRDGQSFGVQVEVDRQAVEQSVQSDGFQFSVEPAPSQPSHLELADHPASQVEQAVVGTSTHFVQCRLMAGLRGPASRT